MAVGLVLRLLEVDVAGGADGLVQLLAQADDGAVELPQLLLRLDHTLAQHEGIVAQRLNLQEIVPGGNALKLRKVFPLYNCLKQLSSLAGRADNESLPVLVDQALGHDGVAFEVVQVRGRDELVEIAKAQLVLGQHD